MKTKVGEHDYIEIDGVETEVIVREAYESEYAWHISYFVPSTEYITQPYYWAKGVGDTSGIEELTGMPLDCAGKLMTDFQWGVYPKDTAEAQAIVSKYLFNFDTMLRENEGLYFYSETKGSGKTFLACCIGNEIIKRRGLNVKFVSIVEYIQAAREKAAQKYMDATVLIIDDFGAQDEKHEWVQELVFRLINGRYERRKMTIFTSNVPIEKCSSDERITQRIGKMATEIMIPEFSVRKMQISAKKKAFWESLDA